MVPCLWSLGRAVTLPCRGQMLASLLMLAEQPCNLSATELWWLLICAGEASQATAEQEAAKEVQMRLPGKDWKERHGAAGVQAEKRRSSPIVELSLLLVRSPLLCSARTLADNCMSRQAGSHLAHVQQPARILSSHDCFRQPSILITCKSPAGSAVL